MAKRIFVLLFSWTVQLIAADQAHGLSYETAVPLRALFFHEVPEAIGSWVKHHVPEAEISADGNLASYEQISMRNGRKYYIEHVRLRSKVITPLYFEIVEPLPDSAANVKELFVFQEVLQIVQKFDQAEACLLNDRVGVPSHKAAFKKIPEDIAVQFRSALLAEASYNWEFRSLCAPVYVGRLRLHRGKETLDLDFCFHCHQIQIRTEARDLPLRDFTSPVFRELFLKVFPEEKNFRAQ